MSAHHTSHLFLLFLLFALIALLMDGWTNEKVVDWLASKGFGVWTPYFRVKEVDGRVFACMTLEELLEGKIERSSAKKILLKRDRQIKKLIQKYVQLLSLVSLFSYHHPCLSSPFSITYAARYPTTLNSDTDASPAHPRRPSDPPPEVFIPHLINSFPNIPISTSTLSQSSSLNSSALLSSSPSNISPLGTSPEKDIDVSAENGDKKRGKGKKKKVKKVKKEKAKEQKTSTTNSTYNADDDASDHSHSETDLSDCMHPLVLSSPLTSHFSLFSSLSPLTPLPLCLSPLFSLLK